uniref:Uncharacterized protein n=1 Tax=Aegilops tauschii subsp. strangulata TaxID=200361 RepID=A0A452XXK2_AEGTS
GQTPWLGYFAPWGAPFPPPARAPWVPPNAAGVLGPRPTAPQQAYPLMYAGPSAPPSHPPSWDPAALYSALNQMTLQQPGATDWYLDTGASAHVTGNAGILASLRPVSKQHPPIIVGNGSRLPVVATGSTSLPSSSRSLQLNNVLFSPAVVPNLISVKQLAIDNSVSVEFDPIGFSVKDLATRTPLMRRNSSGPLYRCGGASPSAFFLGTGEMWHRRLGHPGRASLSHLAQHFLPDCNKLPSPSHSCEACQLGKQPRLPFSHSSTVTTFPFQIIHCDLWTSPVARCSGYKYYLIIM